MKDDWKNRTIWFVVSKDSKPSNTNEFDVFPRIPAWKIAVFHVSVALGNFFHGCYNSLYVAAIRQHLKWRYSGKGFLRGKIVASLDFLAKFFFRLSMSEISFRERVLKVGRADIEAVKLRD